MSIVIEPSVIQKGSIHLKPGQVLKNLAQDYEVVTLDEPMVYKNKVGVAKVYPEGRTIFEQMKISDFSQFMYCNVGSEISEEAKKLSLRASSSSGSGCERQPLSLNNDLSNKPSCVLGNDSLNKEVVYDFSEGGNNVLSLFGQSGAGKTRLIDSMLLQIVSNFGREAAGGDNLSIEFLSYRSYSKLGHELLPHVEKDLGIKFDSINDDYVVELEKRLLKLGEELVTKASESHGNPSPSGKKYKFVVIEELDWLLSGKYDHIPPSTKALLKETLENIAILGRAVGVHLITSGQRADCGVDLMPDVLRRNARFVYMRSFYSHPGVKTGGMENYLRYGDFLIDSVDNPGFFRKVTGLDLNDGSIANILQDFQA